MKRGSFAWRALDAYTAGVLLNDSIRDGQTKAGSLTNTLSRIERVVNLRYVFGSDTDAGIGDLYEQ